MACIPLRCFLHCSLNSFMLTKKLSTYSQAFWKFLRNNLFFYRFSIHLIFKLLIILITLYPGVKVLGLYLVLFHDISRLPMSYTMSEKLYFSRKIFQTTWVCSSVFIGEKSTKSGERDIETYSTGILEMLLSLSSIKLITRLAESWIEP